VAAVIIATLSSATANSYATLAAANTYFETVPDSSGWDNKTTDQKNRALIAATRWIDSLNYYGVRCNTGQSLKWPRNDYSIDGISLDCSSIPSSILYAQFELALAIANDTASITGNTGTTGLYDEVELGDLRVKYNSTSQSNGPVNNVFDVYPWLQSHLGPYVLGGAGGYQVRVTRG